MESESESEQQQQEKKELEEVIKSLPSDVVNDLLSLGVGNHFVTSSSLVLPN